MGFLSSLLSFDRMIAVPVIKIIYFLGIFAIIIAGGTMFLSLGKYGSGIEKDIIVIISTIFSILLWRLICEMWIVIFGIYDRLGQLVKQGNRIGKGAAVSGPNERSTTGA